MSAPLPDIRTAPPAVQEENEALKAALDAQIPVKREVNRNILIATWNIRAFGGLTEKWVSSKADSPKRNYRGLQSIAEIISRFDVIALQEIVGDLKSLRTLIKTLGPNWNFLLTDENRGGKGNGERMGFLFDTTRVQLSGLAGELAAPDDPVFLEKLSSKDPFRQFARTPYAVSFRAGQDTFILVTMHVLYGKSKGDRTSELKAIAEWMADWARQSKRWHQNLLLLGDFNIDRAGDKNFDAFTSTGLTVPPALHDVPRTLSWKPGDKDKYYDQIAWFEKSGKEQLKMELLNAGGFSFKDILFQKEPKLTSNSMSWRVSDHFPLWVEFNGTRR
ncbi:MAG: endonuclease/exonuclease/phosphatase family protein [bacterium]